MILTVGNKIEVSCHEVDFLGQGVSRYDDLVVFTKGLIDGEKALVEVVQIKKRFVFAKLVKLISKSEYRSDELNKLGSLDLYHINCEHQLLWQELITKNAFERQLGYTNKLDPIISDKPCLNYRNKVVYHILDNEVLTLGLYQSSPVKLVRVDDFALSSLVVNKIVSKLNNSQIKIDSSLRQIVFRNNQDNQVLVTLVSKKRRFLGKELIVSLLEEINEVVGITLNLKVDQNIILSDKSLFISGSKYLDFKLNDLTLKVSDQAFLQVNTNVMNKVYQKIALFITNNKVIDAYSGIGSIGLSLANKAQEVILIESSEANCIMAKENIIANKIDNATIYHDKTEDILDKFDADTLIVDPPKAGLHNSLLEIINQKKYSTVIYLSCELKTLVRDLKELTKVYQIKNVIPVRMFPQTTSIETLVVLKATKII